MRTDTTLQFMATDVFAYIVALPASLAGALIITSIGWWVTRKWTDTRQIRRHRSANTYWTSEYDPTVLEATEISGGSSRRRRADPHWDDSDHNEALDAPSTGRRSVANPHRTRVPADWRPVIGAQRIALMTATLFTDTAAYHAVIAVARVPHSVLTTQTA